MTEFLGQLELNRVYHQDCIEGMKMLPEQSVDLIVTDPPYGINFYSNQRKKNKLKSAKGILNDGHDNTAFLSMVIQEMDRVLKPDSHVYWFTRWDRIYLQYPLLNQYFKMKNALVWMKNGHSMGDTKGSYASQYESILFGHKGRRYLNEYQGRKRHTDILQFDRVSPSKLLHSHEKPESLIKFLIAKSSIKGEIILDPFCGSGTTAATAKKLGRNFITFELDKDSAEIANKRLSNIQEEN
ncbi:DNA-methyltransferase [Bacillus inaquosorum]|uniref:DNA-methyltransferase n=1 Tax=Bacillus inaquosorum TaxID=483913 RepID=UPI00227DF04B|nr:site-specific DNA-methyltransferase [Bacillus inaquosorum]MCY7819019.1 site-specific DNA-methyltransferase [Bacillus inaquosorum]